MTDDVLHSSWRALGTSVHVLLTDGDLDAAAEAVGRLLAEVDLAYSRFRPDSELSRLNAAGGARVRVGPLFGQAIAAALDAAQLTGGLVDPTVGRALARIGYDVDFRELTDAGPIVLRVEPVPGWSAVRFDPRRLDVRLERGVELDLGSTGKALAADLAAPVARRAANARGALVSLGGDLATDGEPPAGGWRILATDDSDTAPDSEGVGEVVSIEEGAVATSGTSVRRWTRGEIALHHLIDPRTGLPADSAWRTVTVVAPTCVEANAWATAAIVRGDDAPAWLAATGRPARLVADDGHIVRVGGWPAPDVDDGSGAALEPAMGPVT